MSVFDDVIKKLGDARAQSPDAARHEAEVDHRGVKVRVAVEDFDRLGIRLHELSVEGPEPTGPLIDTLNRQADELSRFDTPPLAGLVPHEVDGMLGAGVLRTRPEDIHKGYFYEAQLDQGKKISVQRHRRDPETHERHRVPFTTPEELFDELVEGIGGVLLPHQAPPKDT